MRDRQHRRQGLEGEHRLQGLFTASKLAQQMARGPNLARESY